jgi:putative SOS response-associated peptidase YedK
MNGRSFGPVRARLAWGDEYAAAVNREILPIAMIETRAAMDNLDEIADTPSSMSARPTCHWLTGLPRTSTVTAGESGAHKLREGRWWLVPWWAKEMPKGAMFNARSETVDTSGASKDAFKSTRCLIPADGFFEWTKSLADGGKDPWHIFLPDHRAHSFAGLWAYNKKLEVTSCTIITQEAGDPMRQLHDRQPVILDPDVYDTWLDPQTPAADAKALLNRTLNAELHFRRVSRAVNNVKNQGAECVEPVNPV